MANIQIKDLPSITDIAEGDVLHINELSTSADKKTTFSDFSNDLINTFKSTNTEAVDGVDDSSIMTPAKSQVFLESRVQDSQLDTSPSALMAVGAFGLGTTENVPLWPNTSLNDVTGVGSGTYIAIGGNTDRPIESNCIVYFSVAISVNTEYQQIAIPVDSTPSSSEIYHRRSSGGTASNPTWSAWRKVWDDGNLVKTTNDYDTTAGRMLQVGDFGVGDGGVELDSGDNLDNINVAGGFYYWGSPAPANAPATFSTMINSCDDSGNATQIATLRTTGETWVRSKASGVWTSWAKIWTESNLVKTTSNRDRTAGRITKVNDYGLPEAINAGTGFDLNTATDSGFYRIQGAPVNAPAGADFGQLIVSRGGDTIFQIVTGFGGNAFYARHGNPAEVGGGGSYTNWSLFYNDANPNVDSIEVFSGTALTRTSPVQYVLNAQASGFTTVIDSSTYRTNDKIIFEKSRASGNYTVNVDANAIVYPDGTSDGNVNVPDGVAMTFTLTKRADLNWAVTVQG